MACGFPLDQPTQIAFSNLVFVYLDSNDFPKYGPAAAEIMHSSVNNFGLLEYLFSIGPPSQPIVAVLTSSRTGGCNQRLGYASRSGARKLADRSRLPRCCFWPN